MQDQYKYTKIKTTIPVEEFKKIREEIKVERKNKEEAKMKERGSNCENTESTERGFWHLARDLSVYNRHTRRKLEKAARLYNKANRITDKLEAKYGQE